MQSNKNGNLPSTQYWGSRHVCMESMHMHLWTRSIVGSIADVDRVYVPPAEHSAMT